MVDASIRIFIARSKTNNHNHLLHNWFILPKSLLLFLLLFTAISLKAQVRKITGIVTYNNERQSNTVIKDVSLKTQTISNDRGEFILYTKTGDTLTFSKEYFITDTLLIADQQFLIIQLRKNPLILKEVIINSTPISAASTYDENKKEYKDIYWKGDKSQIFGIEPPGIGAIMGLTVNIDKLYNALSKQGKDARRMQRTLTSDYKNNIIDRKFNKSLVARITGFKGTRLYDFMDKYRPTFEMANKATDYEITQYIRKKLAEDKKQQSFHSATAGVS